MTSFTHLGHSTCFDYLPESGEGPQAASRSNKKYHRLRLSPLSNFQTVEVCAPFSQLLPWPRG